MRERHVHIWLLSTCVLIDDPRTPAANTRWYHQHIVTSEQTPPTFLLGLCGLRLWRLRAALQLSQAFDLLQHHLKHIFALDDIEMFPDLGIFTRKPLNLSLLQMATKPKIQLAWEVVIELGEEFDIKEEHGRGCQLIGNHVEEDFRTVVFVLEIGALLGFDRHETHLDDVRAVPEEDSFPTCIV